MSKQNPLLSLAAVAARLLPASAKQAVYRNRRLAGWIRRGLNRAAPQGLTTVEVAAGELAGWRLALDLQTEKDYWLGTYEPDLQAAVVKLVRPGMVVFDVGANIGYVSLLLAKAAGAQGTVFSFEALPANLERLRANLALNAMGERVQVVSGAVSDRSTPLRFLIGPSHGMGKAEGSAGRQDVVYNQAVTVPGVVLDEFVFAQGHPAPQAVKMDIEGGEVLALPGMRRLLEEVQPLMLMELHGPESARAAWEALQGAGYRVCRMLSGYSEITSLDDLDWKAYIVAFPR